MKNSKFCSTPPLVENDKVIDDPYEKSNIFNTFFASNSSVPNFNDPAPNLQKREDISSLNSVNTSPFEISKIVRNLKNPICLTLEFMENF